MSEYSSVTITKLISILVAVVVFGAVFVPLMSEITSPDGGDVPVPVPIEDAVGADLGYYTDVPASALSVGITCDASNVTLTGGYSATYPIADMVLMVADNQSLVIKDGKMYYNNGSSTVSTNSVTLTLDSAGLNGQSYNWVYFPTENGAYGSYSHAYNSTDVVSAGSYNGMAVVLKNGAVTNSTPFGVVVTPTTQDDLLTGYEINAQSPIPLPSPSTIHAVDGYWEFDITSNSTAMITKYTKSGSDFVANEVIAVPSTVNYNGDSYTVTAVTDCIDDGSDGWVNIIDDITSIDWTLGVTVTLPNTLTYIGKGSFYNGVFTGGLVIPDSVTYIGDGAFGTWEYNELGFGTLTLSDSLEYIGYRAFMGCAFSGDLIIPDSVTYIGEMAFSNTRFDGELSIGDSLECILPNAFSNSGFTSLSLGDSIVTIYDYAFDECTFNNQPIELPQSAINVESSAFGYYATFPTGEYTDGDWQFSIVNNGIAIYQYTGASDTTVTIPSSFTVNGTAYPVTQIGGGLTPIFDWEVSNVEFILPNTVVQIASSAFYGLSVGESMVIPDSVRIIGADAFFNTNISSVTLGDGIEFIGNRAFDGVFYDTESPLSVLDLPSVTYIGDYAFTSCDGIGELNLGDSLIEIGNYAFSSCEGIGGTLTLPDTLVKIGNNAFECGFTGDLTIPDSVTYIGDSAFHECTEMSGSLVLGDSLTHIGEYAFPPFITGEVVIPDSYTHIDTLAFTRMYNITSVVISNGVESIGQSAFSNCRILASVTFPDSLVEIGDYAFYGCSTLTGSLTIPDSVTTIGDRAFERCTSLSGDLVIPNTVVHIGEYAFKECHGFDVLILCNSETEIEDYAFANAGIWTMVIGGPMTFSESALANNTFVHILNLTDMEITPTSYGLDGHATIQNGLATAGIIQSKADIPLDGDPGSDSGEGTEKNSIAYDILAMIPIFVVIGLFIFALSKLGFLDSLKGRFD